jgi:hypothetical protein
MLFRLVYQGPLNAQTSTNGRVKEKHAIRRALHPQLQMLWNTNPVLKRAIDPPLPSIDPPDVLR